MVGGLRRRLALVLDHRLLLLGASVLYFHAWNSIIIIILVLIVAFSADQADPLRQSTPELQFLLQTHISNRLSMALMYLGLIARSSSVTGTPASTSAT